MAKNHEGSRSSLSGPASKVAACLSALSQSREEIERVRNENIERQNAVELKKLLAELQAVVVTEVTQSTLVDLSLRSYSAGRAVPSNISQFASALLERVRNCLEACEMALEAEKKPNTTIELEPLQPVLQSASKLAVDAIAHVIKLSSLPEGAGAAKLKSLDQFIDALEKSQSKTADTVIVGSRDLSLEEACFQDLLQAQAAVETATRTNSERRYFGGLKALLAALQAVKANNEKSGLLKHAKEVVYDFSSSNRVSYEFWPILQSIDESLKTCVAALESPSMLSSEVVLKPIQPAIEAAIDKMIDAVKLLMIPEEDRNKLR